MSNGENKTTSAKEGKKGEFRKFDDFPNKEFEIIEVLDNPEFSMMWRHDTGMHICPACGHKYKSGSDVDHKFYRIEVLIDNSLDKENIKSLTDIMLLGDTLDNRKMFIMKTKYRDALKNSQKLKHLVGD